MSVMAVARSIGLVGDNGDVVSGTIEEEAVLASIRERVPQAHLGWKPHEKARTLGQLALHVAMVPGAVAELGTSPSPAQAPQFAEDPRFASNAQRVANRAALDAAIDAMFSRSPAVVIIALALESCSAVKTSCGGLPAASISSKRSPMRNIIDVGKRE